MSYGTTTMGDLAQMSPEAREKYLTRGHGEARLSQVFDLVKPEGNWKMPIEAKVPKHLATADELADAVVYYCGGNPEVLSEGDYWVVVGAGYYAWIGS